MERSSLRVVLFILFSYFFIFGIGVGNFGTSIRHRAKFVIAIILISTVFSKHNFSKKKIEYS